MRFCGRNNNIWRRTLSLNSPLKANWFSGFPSGTLYRLNQSTVASRYPGFSRLTSSIPATHRHPDVQDHSYTSPQRRRLLLRVTPTVKAGGFRVFSIDHNDFPVCFSLIDQSQSPQHLNFDHFSSRTHLRNKGSLFLKRQQLIPSICFPSEVLQHLISYVTYIDRIVIPAASRVSVPVVGVLPRLWEEKTRVWWMEQRQTVLWVPSEQRLPVEWLHNSRCSLCEETRLLHNADSPSSRLVSVDLEALWWLSD